MKLPNLFGNSKKKEDPIKEQEAVQKQNVETHRRGGNLILSALERVIVHDKTGTISQEKLQQYEGVVAALQDILRTSNISSTDTSVIDIKLKRFVERFEEAVNNGKEKRADIALSALVYGIDKARVEIQGKTSEQMKPIMKSREEKIDVYETIFGFQEQIDEGRESLKPIENQIKKNVQEYENKMKEISDYCEEHPTEYEELKTLFATNPNTPVPPELLHLDALQTEAVACGNNLQFRVLLREFQDLRMGLIEGLISRCEVALSIPENTNIQELKEQASNIQKNLQNYLTEQMAERQELKELSDRFTNMTKSILSSAELKMEITSTNKEYEKLKKKMEQEKKQKEENAKYKLEKEQEVEEQENEEYLTN